MKPREDYIRASRVDQAITDDGRPRADRLAGNLPTETLVAMDTTSVRGDQTSVTTADSLADQLQDISDLLVAGATTVADTTSLNLTATPTMTGVEIAGDVVDGGHAHDTGTYKYQRKAYAEDILSVNIGTVPAFSTEDHLYTVSGAQSNWPVVLGPPPGLPDGLMWCAMSETDDHIIIRIANVTSSAIAGGTASWRVRSG
jgi:hypothetical protein